MTWRAVGVDAVNWKRGASVLERPELSELPAGRAASGAAE
jgi:hypothetical protein